MPQVSDRILRQLKPYLVGEGPNDDGEWPLHCPIHDDEKRSASLNVATGVWFCNAGCGGGSVLDLIRHKSLWVEPPSNNNGHVRVHQRKLSVATETITMGHIEGWHSYLMSDDTILDDLITKKGIHTKTIIDFRIGYDLQRRVYTIPVFGEDGSIWNVRRYNMYAQGEQPKIRSVRGMRVTELYPVAQLEADVLVWCEGEWDTLLTIQNGYPAITRTSGAKNWDNRWNKHFKGKKLYLAQDADDDGQLGNRTIARQLHQTTDVRIVRLPFKIVRKHGQDLTDFWLNNDRSAFERLLAEAEPWRVAEKGDAEIITVLDSFDAQRVSEPVKLAVTIKGKKDPGYSVPRKVSFGCTRDRGAPCKVCPLNAEGGEATVEIAPTNPIILGIINSPDKQIMGSIVADYGVPGGKCSKLTTEITEHQAVEVLFARPSIDHADGTKASDYKNITITSVGRHDTMPNNTVLVTGALYPSPRDQRNEFLAWEVQKQETSVDRFELTGEAVKLMNRFHPRKGQRPLRKLGEINRHFSTHVTRIVGRPEMHAVMDLTFHSLLQFKFGGQLVQRGWLESLILGDTRTGKSEAAERLVRHYGAGEIVGGEAATLAGLVGGLQQIGGKDWAVTWGVIPINDRRIVVIDEISGLYPEDIAKMSDVRASGMARLTKIQQEVTFARTRLLWLGNPRNGGMDQYTYGVDAIRPLIGNPEDIARFDLAMAVATSDVPTEDYNKPVEAGELRFTGEACHTLLMWVWTREPDQVKWARGSENEVYKQALRMGDRYVEDPPLIQAANARIKIARVATALAARTFSTDKSCENVVVTKEHVQDAVTFIDRVYDMPAFGYLERSRERILDVEEAEENREPIRKYLLENRGLAKFMRSNPRFRRQDIEEVLNRERDAANAIISKLWDARMIRKEGADCRVEPTLHELLREVRW